MQEPKARKDMDPRYLWDLSSIIESAAEFERQFKEAQAQVSVFSTWQGHVGENPRKAIREAMELASRYSEPRSSRYINGVLGAMERDKQEG